ncbi:hypothetical protein [Aquimarina algiphila]|uniref:hypothetical protein n=1 Tax=Aquimarina algiphila TaxID=2047982 RepID=UPI00248FF3BA|nr:hypothetical protein [Aquimarina algiphila]
MNQLLINTIKKEEIGIISKRSLRSVVGGTETRPSLSEITITKEKKLPSEE